MNNEEEDAIAKAVSASNEADELGLRWSADDERERVRREAQVHAELCEFIRTPTSDELGDILFATIRLGLLHGIDPEMALRESVTKFKMRLELLPERPTLADWQRAKETVTR